MSSAMPTQTNIQVLFSAAKGTKKTDKQTTTTTTSVTSTDVLCSTDPETQAFYDSLTPSERIAHTVAVEKLGTSYTVRRTHGFLKWKSLQK